MGYPYGKTYLEQIQESERERSDIRKAYWILRNKYNKDHGNVFDYDLTLKDEFALLGEAFELCSEVVGDITDTHHFLWDILDELLPEN